MTTDTKPLAWFSWSLNSNTGLSTSGSQDGITPEMYGAIMGVLAGRFPEAEIARLQAQVDALAGSLADTLSFVEHHSNRWDGINGKHPNDVVTSARSALAAVVR